MIHHIRVSAAVLALALGLGLTPPVEAQLGVGAGLNFSQIDDIDTGSTSATFEKSTGYHFGLFLNLGSGLVSLRPGVYYHRMGTYDFPGTDDLELSAVEVPIDVKVTLLRTGPADVFLLGGPVVTFPRSGDWDNVVKDVSLSADIGAGVGVRVPGVGLTLMPELRYSLGVSDYLNDQFEIGSVTVTPDDGARRASKFMLRLNVMF